ncbi:CGNR zinc finger domain-containing protein [Streptomyces griseoluteus]|uniref:CGNR zinc finger domain-containing protein n=1 Tax=Streptomyces griseoluteus TaxID=29306 RepID=UPI00368AD751
MLAPVVKIWLRRWSGDSRWRTANRAVSCGPSAGADQQRGPDERGRPVAASANPAACTSAPRRITASGATTKRGSTPLATSPAPAAHDSSTAPRAALLREVFAAEDADTAAATLNRLLHTHTGRVRLSSHDGTSPWHPHLDRADDAPWAEWLLASSCLALTVLLWDRRRPPGGTCASPSCDNVYITRGSGPPRRYCSRRCATRERVAAHRRARAEREAP